MPAVQQTVQTSIATFAENGVLAPIDQYIAANNDDMSVYAKGMYEAYSYNGLRDFFDCNDKYKSAGDFVRNVIEVNLGFINQYTNLKVSFRKHKKGRSISHVIFKYENTWNNDPKAEEHNNQMLDTIRSIKNGEPAQFETDKEVITF